MGIYRNGEERTFKTTLKSGNNGEKKVRQLFKDLGFNVTNCANNPKYQDMDVDFKAISTNGKMRFLVEVKSDRVMHKSGNIAVELWQLRGENGKNVCKGWYHKCQADILVFYDEVQSIAYLINWPKLKELVDKKTWPERKFYNGTDDCTGVLNLISVNELERRCLLMGTYKI